MPGLKIHKVAEPSDDTLMPRPLAGVRLLDAPPVAQVPTKVIATAVAEGWASLENETVVHRPGGPAADPWQVTHTFRHAEAIVFHTLDGDVRYRVTHQPDKYADYSQATFPDAVDAFDGDDDTPVTDDLYAAGATRIDWFYGIEKEV